MKKSILLLLAFVTLLFSCDKEDSDLGNETEVNTIQLTTSTTLGSVLTDSKGMSLYIFSKDTKEDSECTNGCKSAWPVFYTEEITLDAGLEASDFGVITREDGDKQTTYKGWPLYYHVNDTEIGDTSGDKVGNNWFVAKPDYSLMYGQTEDLGSYLTSATGRTVYLFTKDAKDTNNFTNQDLSNNGVWPMITIDVNELPSILDKADFGTINVFGTTQVTYKGWPLYYFGNDVNRGDVNGVSAVWPTVNTDTEAAIEIVVENNTVKLATNATHGNILTDADGKSLYFFSKDTKEISECSNGCKAAWPVFYSEDLRLDTGLEASDFGVITREDGDKQTTYKGWPLYYYASDSSAGDVNGDQVGDNWYVAKPDYSLMYGQTTELGFYITSATGRTVYSFANDTENKNNFTNEGLSNNSAWPIITVSIENLPSILDKADFGTIDVFGTTQVTYKGRPLYYFGNDTNRGDANGVSGTWPTVNTETTSLISLNKVADSTNSEDTDSSYNYYY